MEVPNLYAFDQNSSTSCKCYKVANLIQTIVDATEISNFKDRYVLGEQLGWGRFGIIRACRDKVTGEVLACKSISKDRLITLDDVNSVKLEIEIMIRLSGHPNVVNLAAVYEEDNYVHLLMELCAGGELFHRLEKHGRFSEHNARVIFRHLMQVVQYCHDHGIVHRDLKPENILLATKSSSSPIKLADFGLATYIKPGNNLHGTVGSPFYIAPEVLVGEYNQAADLWSAGVILYILLSGMPPFWGKTKSRIFDAVRAADLRFAPDPWDTISAFARDLISGMLCVDSSKRLTAAQVLAHPWMRDCAELVQETCEQDNLDLARLETGRECISITSISRDQDYSFSYPSPLVGEGQPEPSPYFTSSFSSMPAENDTTYAQSVGFSFSNRDESSGAIELPFPIPSMSSFAFFSPDSAVNEGEVLFQFDAIESQMDPIHGDGEPTSTKRLVLPDTSLFVKRGVGEMTQRTEFRREGMNRSKASNIHSRRNHTIGLGEFDQLDIIVAESVIRWVSCTQIPTSLRLSLVC
ncbi:calcium-dependent protein kinase 26 isoform X2 [Mercurialis annua]|uniref:calcium-dependent protein kinase 26 isoform X2 n=1 Tax=Mercurialis annua TaxID=3986 RepID=UPI0021601E88|nr:calcium-dependent protein kinase 26 isoform X2 [Mercurialis annua]